MSDVHSGKLLWIGKKSRLIEWTSKGGKPMRTPPKSGHLAADLAADQTEVIEIDYEFDSKDASFPARVRRKGSTWGTAAVVAPPQLKRGPQQPGAKPYGQPSGKDARPTGSGPKLVDTGGAAERPQFQAHFHNPYNFIPAVVPVADARNPLGQHKPAGHGAYFPDRFSGRLVVTVTARTPLLIPDVARAQKIGEHKDHVLLPLLTDTDGKPVLPVTSFKGPLRAAYEAVTNSRLAVFQGHDEPLGRRAATGESLQLFPARIKDEGTIELFLGSHTDLVPVGGMKPPNSLMYAAWLRQYSPRGQNLRGPAYDNRAVKYPDGTYPEHGQEVVCWLRRARKERRFDYWRVEAIRKGNSFALLPSREEMLKTAPSDIGREHQIVGDAEPIRAHGYVCITNQNIGRKHDERVFFIPERNPSGSASVGVSLSADEWDGLAKDWKLLIHNYVEKNQRALTKRKDNRKPADAYLGSSIGETAFSRHLYAPNADTLKPGDLVYAKLDARGRPVRFYPVMISRDLAEVAPETLLPKELRPAATIDETSPADRVFGFVDQRAGRSGGKERRAYKGQLRIASLRFDGVEGGGSPISQFPGDGLPLTILSTPKPEQARFYVAGDTKGAPQRAGISKEAAAYAGNKGLRGRKTYLHHADLPDGYWNGEAAVANPSEALGGRYREFVRQGRTQDDQNRSIGGWVNVGARFRAEIDVINLSKEELGALVFLLTLEPGHHLRVGGGKPLGFGSIELALDTVDIADGTALAAQARALVPAKDSAVGQRYTESAQLKTDDGPLRAYKKAAEDAYASSGKFEQISFIRAFHNAARGFPRAASAGLALPVHYPRASAAPSADGKNYAWFVANDRTGREAGPAFALDPLADPAGLPIIGGS